MNEFEKGGSEYIIKIREGVTDRTEGVEIENSKANEDKYRN